MSGAVPLPGMPPDPVRPPDPYAGLSYGRRRTIKQRELIDAGYNPATRLPILDGERTCKECALFLIKDLGSGRRFFKCRLQLRPNWTGMDVRKKWPACIRFVEGDSGGDTDR